MNGLWLPPLVLGMIVAQYLPSLPNVWASILLAILAFVCSFFSFKSMRYWFAVLTCFMLGMSVSVWQSEHFFQDALPEEWVKKTVIVEGIVAALPHDTAQGRRFIFEVKKVETEGARVPKRLQLFDSKTGFKNRWQAGTVWRAKVRLKPIHGELNGAGFPSEARWFTQRVLATGSAQALSGGHFSSDFFSQLHRWRAQGLAFLKSHSQHLEYGALLRALALGDQSEISREHWQLFQRTGVIHLVSISGVHLTLLAVWVMGLMKLCLRVFRVTRLAHRSLTWGISLSVATGYALMAGFSIPTQRSLFMLWALAFAYFRRQHWSAVHIWCFALACVLCLDVFAVWTIGFWLSFGTVALMMFGMSGKLFLRGHWTNWIRAQSSAFWATCLPTLVLFGSVAWIAPLANVYAIPMIGGLCTMVILLGTILGMVCSSVLPIEWAHELLSMSMQPIEYLGQFSVLSFARPNTWALVGGMLGTALLLLPRAIGAWRLGVLLLLPVLFAVPSRPKWGEVRLDVLEVGQGLAVWISTKHHDFLYDTGAKRMNFDAGERFVLPHLRAHGVERLSGLMISHDDSDHAGGAPSIVAALDVDHIWTANVARLKIAGAHSSCLAGQVWEVDGVEFAFLSPERSPYEHEDDNDFSCVLRVRSGRHAMLLTGDISAAREQTLVKTSAEFLRSNVLLAAHHGSKTSSSEAFLSAVAPEHIIVSAGFLNAYRHPHPNVWARFSAHASYRWRTDRDGAIFVHLSDEAVSVTAARARYWRYWFDAHAGSGK